jgi:hypothetical protein
VTPIVVGATAVAVVLLLAVLVGRAPGTGRSAFEAAVEPAVGDPTVEVRASEVAARRVIVNAVAPRSRYLRSRPVLAELTEGRLRDRHGIGLESPRAGAIVGEPLWSIVRPDARAPDHDDDQLTMADIAAVLDRLDAL